MSAEKPLKAMVVGMSTTEVCGVRDHADLLARGLADSGMEVTTSWLMRTESTLGAQRRELARWLTDLERQLQESQPDFVLLHYSVFAFSHRGVPLFVAPLTASLRRCSAPVITVIHEAVYPWAIGGLRGKLWAFTQRVLLIDVMRSSRAVLVTADFRAEWLRSRRWLARRPIAVAPVYSNLPAPRAQARGQSEAQTIGLFGYSYEGAAISLVLDALSLLRTRVDGARLLLLGAPGGTSAVAEEWQRAAAARGLADALSFTGTLSAQDLSDALARCAVLLFVNSGGPSSRKGTLAGSLGSGSPVVALDGPRRWSEIVDGDAVRLVGSDSRELARVVGELLADPLARTALGERGRHFATERMGPARTVQTIFDLLDQAGIRAALDTGSDSQATRASR